MPQNFIAGDEAEQAFLLPPDVRDWLPADDLAWLVVEVVDRLDLAEFYGRYRSNGQGKAAFHPAVMLAILIYAHARGIRSSRLIERMLVLDVGFRVVGRNLRPDHATIARFVVRHEQDLEKLFGQALRLCAAAGLVNVGVIAVDGTKIAASASWSANKTEAALGHLVAEQQELLTEEQAAALAGGLLGEQTRIDAAEDAVHGARRGDELPPELARPAERLKRLQAAQARLVEEREAAEKAQQVKIDAYQERKERGGRLGRRPLDKPRGPASGKAPRANTTDPDSRAMRGKAGLVQGYNGQAAVTENQIIVGAVLTQKPTDITLLHDVLGEVRTQLGQAGLDPAGLATVLADAGYASEDAFARAEAAGLRLLAPIVSDEKRALGEDPAGGRDLAKLPATGRAQATLRTPQGQTCYKLRGRTVEPVFGQIKDRLKLRTFSRRGLAACRSEWSFSATVHNIRKLHTHRCQLAA